MPRAAELLAVDRPLVIAHRGNSSDAPENTLPAFASALQLGVQAIELDFQQTNDGELVVFHDDTLCRTTNATWVWKQAQRKVADVTLAELRQLDAGSWFSPAFLATRIPTLDEALRCIAPRAVPVVERKTGSAAQCVALLESLELLSGAIVMAFDWQFLADCRARAEALVLVALGEGPLTAERLQAAKRIGAAAVAWSDADLDSPAVGHAQGEQLPLWVWTVDQIPRAQQLLGWGASAVVTNRPAQMLAALGR